MSSSYVNLLLRLAWAASILLVGCTAEPATEWVSEGSLSLYEFDWSDTPVRSSFPLGDGRLLVDTGEGLQILGELLEAEVISRPDEIGELIGVVRLERTWLVLGTEKLVVLRGRELFASELQRALADGEHIRQVLRAERGMLAPDLWVLGEQGLYLYRDEGLSEVTLAGGTSLEEAFMAVLPREEGDALWLATPSALYEIEAAGGGLRAGVVPDIAPSSMATDREGRLWWSEGSTLSYIDESRITVTRELPFEPDRVLASPGHGDLWVIGEHDVWHHASDVFRSVDDFDADAQLTIDSFGHLFAAGALGVVELAARNPLRIEGVLEQQRITMPRRLQLDAEAAIMDAELRLDGEFVELDAQFAFELPVESLDLGPHRLLARAGFDDGTLDSVVEVEFVVTLGATWAEDIRPIFAAECAMCHGESGSATTRLETSMDWSMNIENILFNVREERMPIDRPPLTDETIGLIEAWADSGFPQ